MRFMTLILILSVILLAACASNRFDGDFSGELRSESFRENATTIQSDEVLQTENGLIVRLSQSGDHVSIAIQRSLLLGDCLLSAKISKNGTAYLETPQTCTDSLPLEGTLNVAVDELNLVLRGFDSTSSKTFRFRGYRK